MPLEIRFKRPSSSNSRKLLVNIVKELMLKKRLGQAIANVPGKSEDVLMVGFQDNYPLYLRGNGDEPLAYIEVAIFGTEHHIGYQGLNADITQAFYDVLGIEPDHLYIKYDDITSWGV